MPQFKPLLTTVELSNLKRASFVDLATSTRTRADYTVVATVGKDQAQNLFILSILRGRWEWPEAYEEIVAEIVRQDVRLAGVESNGFQLSSFQELVRDERLSNVAFYPVPMETDKVSRALLVSSRGASNKLYYLAGAAWAEEAITEFVNFPSGKHDDIVDAVTGCVELLNKYEVEPPVVAPGLVEAPSIWRR